MMMPDPYADRTIEVVQEEKQATKKEQDESGEDELPLIAKGAKGAKGTERK